MNKHFVAVSTLLILGIGLVACGPTAAPTALATPTALPPTATVPLSAPTAVPPTATSVPLTPTPPPPAPTEVLATRIQFETGATSTTVAGSIAAGGVVRYVLAASAGQVLELDLSAPENAVGMQVWGADGEVLMSSAAATGFRGLLRTTQDYYVGVIGNAAANYSLFVRIPERIAFAPGGTSAVLEGQLAAGDGHAYVLGASEGQWMDVSLSAPENTVHLVIYGMEGTVLVSGMGDQTMFRGTLPITEDYIIIVQADAATQYSLNVAIPERIAFSPGAVSATRTGSLAAWESHEYVVGAQSGQTMEVHVSAPAGTVRLVIWGVDGSVLRSGMGEGADFVGTVPSTQDYFIEVGANQPIEYTIVVQITG